MNHTLRLEDALKVVLITLLGIRTGHHGQILWLGRILGKKTHEALNREIQTLAIRVAIAVQNHYGVLGNPKLTAKSRTIGKRLEDLGIRCVPQYLHPSPRTPRKIRLLGLGPLGRKGVDRLASLIQSIEQRLGNPKLDLIKLRPDRKVSLLAIVLDGLEKLVDNERIIVEKNKLRVDRINLLRKLVESKALLTRILCGCRVLRNDTLGNLAMIGVPWVTLESKVKDLDLRGERCHLAEKILGNLGVTRGLIHVRADKKNPH